MIHSIVRWLIVAVAVVAMVRFALGLAQRSDYDGMSRGLMAGFSGLMDLQFALGLIFLLWSGLTGAGFPLYRIEHAIVMAVAAVVAHIPGRNKDRPANTCYRIGLLSIVASLVLVYVGVALLPGGWSR
jgi:hypothetical protein